MSWPVASFVVVGALLVAGWLAYERARPPARTIAVVATLAALAALGRDAFVALPDVKPITAITLVVGYALGPLAGFAVGAIGMLASNILLGEGPYTPWQMVAWGLVGLLGALLGLLSARRLPRPALAVACAMAALMAKEIMNLYEWSLGGLYTPAALLAKAAQGLPFDLTDAVASALFGLAFAPELARLLARVRARMEVRWDQPAPAHSHGQEPPRVGAGLPGRVLLPVVGAIALTALAAGLASAPLARAEGPGFSPNTGRAASLRSSAPRAPLRAPGALVAGHPSGRGLAPEVRYLRDAQDPDGGFGAGAGEPSSELYSAWAAMGLAAAGRDPLAAAAGRRSVLDALRAEAGTLSGPADAERTMLALHACGAPAVHLGRLDLERAVLRARASDGSFGEQVNVSAFAILALRAAGRRASDPVLREAAAWLERQQGATGGFGFASGGGAADVDDSGAVLEALAASARPSAAALTRAASYLLGAQNRDGGFPQQPGGPSNAQSTAWAVQGLLSAGAAAPSASARSIRSALRYLRGLVAPDGSIRYARGVTQTPVWVTAQAMMALASRTLPLAAPVSTGNAGAAAPRPRGAASSANPARPLAPHAGGGSRQRLARAGARGGGPAVVLGGLLDMISRELAAAAREALGLLGVVAAQHAGS